jgi:hypothetical protein
MTEIQFHRSGEPIHDHRPGKMRGFVARSWTYLLGWFGLSGLIASSTTCPYCGQVGCPVGLSQAAGLGFASMGIIWLFTKFSAKRPPTPPKPPSAAG